ncbi:MAG: undecaprenyldiphospho-muramoylpentapeptide beta-N-acetylglucosaminyltransferase [Alphaproteobacteria bacterium]|nr:undecaprenyldiphospho-muramoylpentapeptide beta-N-acetylglucosaminyltransferase [Alphaproteobacteria bacterium]
MPVEQAKYNIVIAAGGTGGHMYPAEALAKSLLDKNFNVNLITDQRGKAFSDKLPQVHIYKISAGGIAGINLWRKIKSLLLLVQGYWEARYLLKKISPAVVIGFGGYASIPTVLAATHLKISTLIHEQNAVLGRANRVLANKVDIIALSLKETKKIGGKNTNKTVLVGNPVRMEFVRPTFSYNFNNEVINILVTGGSQGTRSFSKLIPMAIDLLPKDIKQRIKITQQCRSEDIETTKQHYKDLNIDATLAPFFYNIADHLEKSHLIICRAGASSVTEIISMGRPSILIPYPYAIDDHQTANAQALCIHDAAWIMPEKELTPQKLSDHLHYLFLHPELLEKTAYQAWSLAKPEAVQSIIHLIEQKINSSLNIESTT